MLGSQQRAGETMVWFGGPFLQLSSLVVPSLNYLKKKKKDFAKGHHSWSPTSTTRIFIEYSSNVTFKASNFCVSYKVTLH